MLLGALAALIAWGIAYLMMKQGINAIVSGAVGAAVAIGLSWVAAIAMLGAGAIPIGGIVGAIIGGVGAVVAAKRAAATPKA
jgi:hypothetical protein